MNRFIHNFIHCGLLGWCLEIVFTAFHAFRRRDFRLAGTTSIWMFPIYGCAAIIGSIYPRLSSLPFYCRGILYAAGFYLVEFSSGILLKHFGMCPWDYSAAPLQYHGVVRLDYAPLWFFAGLIFEKILANSS